MPQTLDEIFSEKDFHLSITRTELDERKENKN